MKKTSLFLACALALGLSASSARAQGGLPPLYSLFDADQNGVLSSSEITGAARALLQLDANHDGAIQAGELCPAEGRGWGRRPGGCPGALNLFDADADGVLSPAEIQGAPRALATLDTDGDGQITGSSFCPGRGRGGPGWAGRGGPRWTR